MNITILPTALLKNHDGIRAGSVWTESVKRVRLFLERAGSRHAIIVLALVLLLPSCQPFSPRVSPGLSADNALLENGATNQLDLVNDVPIPAGSVLDTQLSLVLGRGSRWTGRLVLRLNIPPAQVSSIYQNEMPAFGWQPLFNIQEGFGLSAFSRGDRVASVKVEPLGLRGSRVSITVALRTVGGDETGDVFNIAPRSGSSITPGIQ